MSFRAELKMNGKDYLLLHCSYTLDRDIDVTGRPSSEVHGGTIAFEMESTDDTSFLDWIVAQYRPLTGSIIFKKRDEDAKMKELKFEKAYAVRYYENFDATGNKPMTLSFTLSAYKITLGSETHENQWPV